MNKQTLRNERFRFAKKLVPALFYSLIAACLAYRYIGHGWFLTHFCAGMLGWFATDIGRALFPDDRDAS